MKRVLVTGGAGYVGSHVVDELVNNGFSVTIVDDLSTGNSLFINPKTEFFEGSILNDELLETIFSDKNKSKFDGVIHLAGIKYASMSVTNPSKFYEINTVGTTKLITKMITSGVKNLVYSSSCSVYGQPVKNQIVDEFTDLRPLSPYGRSKVLAESVLNSAVDLGEINAVSLRYFNVIGSKNKKLLDLSPYNLLPNIYRAISENKVLPIYGNIFDTPDGTAIRDYVDVEIIARAHIGCLEKLISGVKLKKVYNLGSEVDLTIKKIVSTAMSVISPFNVEYLDARPGDPARIVANCTLAKTDLNWNHNKSLEEMLISGWESWQEFHIRSERKR